MRQWGLFWSLFAAFALLSAATATLFGVLALPGLTEGEEAEAEDLLDVTAGMLEQWARPVLEGAMGPEELQAHFEELRIRTSVRLTVVAASGRVVADTHHDPRAMGNHSGRPEIVAARARGVGRASRRSETLDTRMLYVARAVREKGAFLGTVRVSRSLRSIDARIGRLRAMILTSALGATLAGLAFSFFISRRLARPIRALSDAVTAVAHGDYSRTVPVRGTGEIARLAETFNGMAEDLRERVETISRDRTELRAMLSAMAEGVVAVDPEERVVLINDAAGRLLDVEPEDAVGRRIWEVTGVRGVGEVLVGALGKGRREECEVRIPGPLREGRLQLLAAPVGTPAGEVLGAVLVLRDISELRHLEQVRRDFVANVSHELKTPLAAIRGFAETILEDPAMDADTRRHFVERIRRQAVRLADLVEEVLALSRLESEDDAVSRKPVDILPGLRDTLQSLQPLAREKRITLEATLPEARIRVRGDEEAVRRIASNLLDNALKYTGEGGSVWVRLQEVGPRVRLEVEDTGIGIPEESRERVFERFYRVDPGRSRAAGGTGLGLSIVKHLVQAMGGNVRVGASEGGGSVFVVELPIFGAETGTKHDDSMTAADAVDGQ